MTKPLPANLLEIRIVSPSRSVSLLYSCASLLYSAFARSSEGFRVIRDRAAAEAGLPLAVLSVGTPRPEHLADSLPALVDEVKVL